MAEKNMAGIGFEKQIWDVACVLRRNIDASEYKTVVRGLNFLKYLLVPNTVRFICEANGYDAEKIGQHFLEILPKITEQGDGLKL